jgi:enoyl-CoA hydratase
VLDPARYETIAIDLDGDVAVLTLNRPERLNAVNGDMHSELTTIFGDVMADSRVRVAVLTGAGRGFCAGGDFSTRLPPTGRKTGLTLWQEGRIIVDSLLDCEKPVVAAVNGPAAGLGATIALLCDIVVASENARIGDPHVKMGLTAGDGGAVIWPLLIGVNRAKELLMTGDLLSARQAYEMGLVNHVVEEGQALPRALEIAHRLAAGAPFAVNSSKVSVNALVKAVANLVLPLSLALENVSMASKDHEEAVRAFQEKREPKFTGR